MSGISSYAKFWVTGFIIIALWSALYLISDIIILIWVSLIISLGIDSLITSITRVVKHRIVAILIAYVLLIISMLTGIILIIPLVLGELSQIGSMLIDNFHSTKNALQSLWIQWYIWSITRLPTYFQNIIQQSLSNQQLASNLQSILTQNISDIISISSNYIGNVWSIAVWFVSNIFEIIFKIWLCSILSIFFSIEKENLIHFASSLAPSHKQWYVTGVIYHLYDTMWLRLKWQLALCILISIVVGIFLGILAVLGIDLDQVFSLALIAWFTEFIPYAGPLLGAIPAVLIATMLYGWKGLIVVWFWYFIIQWLENNIFIPLIMKKTMWVNPLLIFLCMIITGSLIGIIWVILAVPCAQICTILYREYMTYKQTHPITPLS